MWRNSLSFFVAPTNVTEGHCTKVTHGDDRPGPLRYGFIIHLSQESRSRQRTPAIAKTNFLSDSVCPKVRAHILVQTF